MMCIAMELTEYKHTYVDMIIRNDIYEIKYTVDP